MKKILHLSLALSLLSLSLILSGCNTSIEEETLTEETSVEDTIENKVLFENYQSELTPGEVGDFVIAPAYSFLEEAYAEGVDETTFIYYEAELKETGEEESILSTVFDEGNPYPNYMFIDVPKGQTAKAGDIILTTWQSGSGLQRSIVQADSNENEPTVYHLDMDYDNPAGIAQETDSIKANSFYVLSNNSDFELGKTVACKTDSGFTHGILVSLGGENLLSLEWAGSLNMHKTADCLAVNPYPELSEGQTVYFPSFGTYEAGTISKIDASIGRAWIDSEFAGEITSTAIGMQDILTEEPSL